MRAWDTDLQKVTLGRQHVIPFGHPITKFVSLPVFSDELPSGQDHKAVVSSIRELRLQAEIVAGRGCKTGKVERGPGKCYRRLLGRQCRTAVQGISITPPIGDDGSDET